MQRSLFVNIPVKSLERSMEFFKKLGFQFNKDFTNDKGAMINISDTAFVMLLTQEFFKTFTKKTIGDARTSPEVIISLSAQNNGEVDTLAAKVQEAGGKVVDHYTEMEESMYGIRFEDLDGHLWEIFYMDMEKVQHMQKK